MAGLIAGTWSLISSSAEVIKRARGMKNRVQRLLQDELCERDRRRLVDLQKRVECLVQPLNFLVLWSKKRDSCVQQAVLNAQELLFDVCNYVERFVPQHDSAYVISGGKGIVGAGGGSLDADELEYYLRELEFACASVSMAVNITRAIDTPTTPQMPLSNQDVAGDNDNSISLSALLRASRRIQEMRGHTGDLCACLGRLYTQALGSRAVPAVSSTDSAGHFAADALEGVSDDGDDRSQEWTPVFSLATFKVVASDDFKRGRRRYHISVDSRLPLSQRDCSPPPTSHDLLDDESVRGLNSNGPLAFPMEVALEACLVTTASMALPAESAWSLRDLGIDSLVLVWGMPASASDVSFGESADFPDAVLLPDVATSAEGLQRVPLRAVSSLSLRPPVSGMRPSSSLQGRYAFVFEGPRGTAEPRAGESEVALTPLDALYLARLCALDGGPLAAVSDNGCSEGGINACPPHLLSSDEVLTALLQEGVVGKVNEKMV